MDMTTELTVALEAMDPEMIMGALAGLGIVFTIAVVFALVRYLMHAIGYSAMYRKAGVAGWKAFIPFYGKFIRYKLYWDKKYFLMYAIAYLVMTVLGSAAEGIMGFVVLAASIVVIVTTIKVEFKCARCFGKGAGMGILLVIMPWLANIILGFGKAEYTAIEK